MTGSFERCVQPGNPATSCAFISRSRQRKVRLQIALALVGVALAGFAHAAAELGITKATGNPNPTAGGAAFSYTLVVTNSGTTDALNVQVVDPLPASVVFQGVSVVNSPSVPGFGLICSGPGLGSNGPVTCTGTLPAAVGNVNSTATITIVAQIAAATASGVRTNTASVSSTTQEASPNVQPNSASVQQNIQVNAPLTISLAGPQNVTRGSNIVYTLTINNGGPSTAINATITDSLPANTSFVSMYGTRSLHEGCTVSPANVITCAAVEIPTGQSALTIVARTSPITPAGNLSNTASITTAGTGSIVTGSATSTATVNP